MHEGAAFVRLCMLPEDHPLRSAGHCPKVLYHLMRLGVTSAYVMAQHGPWCRDVRVVQSRAVLDGARDDIWRLLRMDSERKKSESKKYPAR